MQQILCFKLLLHSLWESGKEVTGLKLYDCFKQLLVLLLL